MAIVIKAKNLVIILLPLAPQGHTRMVINAKNLGIIFYCHSCHRAIQQHNGHKWKETCYNVIVMRDTSHMAKVKNLSIINERYRGFQGFYTLVTTLNKAELQYESSIGSGIGPRKR